MVQPFDYTTMIANPGAAFQQSYVQGMELRAAQEAQAAARAEAQRKAAEQQQLRAAMTAFGTAKTPAEKVAVMERYPMFAKPISDQYNAMDEMTRKPVFDAGLRGYAALRGGDAAAAARVWRETGTAFTNSGKPELAKQFTDLADIAEKDPNAADIMSSAFLAGTDGKRFKEFGEATGGAKDTAFQRDYLFIKDKYGNEAADAFANNRVDPQAVIPLPNGQVYVGPRSGITASMGQPAKTPQVRIGTIEDGYRFKGGDPAKPENWEKVR
jgi:hypothetical protein